MGSGQARKDSSLIFPVFFQSSSRQIPIDYACFFLHPSHFTISSIDAKKLLVQTSHFLKSKLTISSILTISFIFGSYSLYNPQSCFVGLLMLQNFMALHSDQSKW